MTVNPGWSEDTPFRTGVPTVLQAARIICRILAVFTPVIKEFLDSDKHVYVDALNVACSEFVDNVPPPRP